MFAKERNSPYATDANRLNDVIAAIQAMAVYKFYKLDFAGWADRISGTRALAGHWKQVFTDHPEFFRLDSTRTKASLVWRRQYPKRYSVDAEKVLTKAEYDQLDDRQKLRVSRVPLSAQDINALTSLAVNIHARALEHKRDSRWLLVALLSGLFSLLGAFAGAKAA